MIADCPIASFPPPRPFQVTAHQALRTGFLNGHRCQVLMAPTGSGKTFLGMQVIYEALKKGKRALFCCDRTTLIEQTSQVAESYGLTEHGIIQADHWRKNDCPFQIGSIQTLMRRGWPRYNVCVIDEVHAQYKTWIDEISKSTGAFIGLSATPFSKGLGNHFSNLVNATTMNDLVKSGVLTPLRVFACVKPDMKGAETSGGEWTDRAAAERGSGIIGDVVSEWCKFSEGRKTICFGATIEHCEKITKQFNECGIVARTFTSNTPDGERAEILKEYRKHDSTIRVLVSVEALAKGFDVPDVACVVDCRPLRKSLSTAIQMWGRGMRSSPGKVDCRLLDHSGNFCRFLADFEDIYYNGLDALDAGEKLDKTIRQDEDAEPKGCPKCGHKPFFKHCVACGYERPPQPLIEHEPGVMKELRLTQDRDVARELWNQVCSYVRAVSGTDKPLNKQAGRAWYLFRDLAGYDAPKSFVFDEAPIVPISKNVAGRIKSRNIAFAKARRKPNAFAYQQEQPRINRV